MTGDEFKAWLKAMKDAELARSDADCGRLLGISADTIVRIKDNGGDTRTALACGALIDGVAAWPR